MVLLKGEIEKLKLNIRHYGMDKLRRILENEELRNNPEIVMEAVKNNGEASNLKKSYKDIRDGIEPREGEIKEVVDETIAEQSRINSPDQKKEGKTQADD